MKRVCVVTAIAIAGAAACAGYFAATKYKKYVETKLRADDAVNDLTEPDEGVSIPVTGPETHAEDKEADLEKETPKEPEKAEEDVKKAEAKPEK